MNITNKSTVELIDHMGTDLTVVNAARVSFNKESKYELDSYDTQLTEDGYEQYPIFKLSKQDEKLIRYLAKHNHWSPFAHTSIQLRVSAPIFVARQLVKHQVGGVWNEVSHRYVDDEPVFYFPDKWRERAENVKQGSSEKEVVEGNVGAWARETCVNSLEKYKYMLEWGVAPEQARMILPQNMMTSWYWTGSLVFFHRVYKQRIDPQAQLETQEVAKQIGEICEKLFPISWNALTKE